MARYYKPTKEELVEDLLVEIYSQDNKYKKGIYWKPILLNKIPMSVFSKAYDNGDIRVRYLDSFDFNELGYIVKKTFLGKQTHIIDILPDDTEVTEERDVFNEEILIIIKDGIPKGKFLPYAPNQSFNYNVEYKGKKHTIKNLTELRKILK